MEIMQSMYDLFEKKSICKNGEAAISEIKLFQERYGSFGRDIAIKLSNTMQFDFLIAEEESPMELDIEQLEDEIYDNDASVELVQHGKNNHSKDSQKDDEMNINEEPNIDSLGLLHHFEEDTEMRNILLTAEDDDETQL
ncbi:hypothetical protein CFOL_v3_10167 [Cephalotus follicularis]|uniref:Uncharacterized protein n=1 Tax=Cephalotus follicularis TaxID=3775 RepID=A0A1Q3BF53_CEPFO|nr:hypothetical protein CFOL_v3_10167 [Cephalotus follicularis]